MNTYEQLINKLSQLQNNDGSFSQSTIPYGPSSESVYYTALIIIILEKLPTSPTKETIIQNSLSFLKQEMSVSSTWNYIARKNTSPYPDDLDDTFLVITAITLHDKSFITPEFLVSITNLLINQETIPGGPYKTWITNLTNWDNVDIVTNANIYRFLGSQGIFLPQLETYFREKIISLDFTSQYYYKTIIVIYFLSECLPSLLKDELTKTITNNPKLIEPANDLEHHLLTILFHNLGHSSIKNVSTKHHLSHSSLHPFFIEKINNGEVIYSTCAAFELAIALQVHLLTSTPQVETEHRIDTTQSILNESLLILESLLIGQPLLKEKILEALKQLTTTHSTRELLIPYTFYTNLNENYRDTISHETIHTLCLSTLLGWIGFTIQDEIIDHESPVERLPLATTSILLSQELVYSVLFGSSDATVIQSLFYDINESLLEEITNHTFLIVGNCLDLTLFQEKLQPIIQSSKKSIGIALGPISLTLLLPITHSYHFVALIKDYFQNLLTVKQTLDDMHDWYSDLERGYINPITAKIINRYRKNNICTVLNFSAEKTTLHHLFWNHVFDDLYQELILLIQQARTTVAQLKFLEDTLFLIEPLDRYLKILERTHEQRDLGVLFLSHYKKTTSQ
ncbi:MAG: hypothetical protein WCG20_02635 [bacterium]